MQNSHQKATSSSSSSFNNYNYYYRYFIVASRLFPSRFPEKTLGISQISIQNNFIASFSFLQNFSPDCDNAIKSRTKKNHCSAHNFYLPKIYFIFSMEARLFISSALSLLFSLSKANPQKPNIYLFLSPSFLLPPSTELPKCDLCVNKNNNFK